jgi:hypothetical protein
MFFREPNTRNISEWVEVVTRRIAAPANERIGREIGAHYAEAVVAHVGGGLSESEANAAALGELGDARQAARRFRRQHLTVRDARKLKVNDEMVKSILQLTSGYLLFFTFGLEWGRTFPGSATRILLLFMFLVVFPTTAHVLARRKAGYPGGWLGALIRSGSSTTLGFQFCFAFGMALPPPLVFFKWLFWILRLVVVVQLLLALRLAIKLHGLQNSSDEIPPRDAAFS